MATSQEGVVFRKEESEECDIWDDKALIIAYDKAVKAAKDDIIGENVDDEQQQGASTSQDKQLKPEAETSKDDQQKPDGFRNRKKKQNKRQRVKKKKVKSKWFVGDRCRAMYSDDGVVYDAVIKSIDKENNKCWVLYTDYGNEEEIDIGDVLLPESDTEGRENLHVENGGYDSQQSMEWDQSQSPMHPGSRGGQPYWQQHERHPPPPAPPRIPNFNPMNHPYYHPFSSGYPPSNPWLAAMHHGTTPPRIPPIPPPPPVPQDALDGDEDALFSMLISWYMSGYHTGYYQGVKAARAPYHRESGRTPSSREASQSSSRFRQPRSQREKPSAGTSEPRR